ncbi:ABC transporter ATP-binding protein [Bdellovibrio sp. HCB337]|uniref:ABC transporter ATP-binding protein n=1 Tax=Bdellovibrio sp. HCB337 TaxID=3394358 RepID=UPI0039A4A53B
MNPLEIEHLKKYYGNAAAVKDVSFTVHPAEIFGLLGPNGAGKTTIISTVTTLEKPTEGTVKVFGEDVTKNPMFTKKQLGVVHQEVINSGYFSVEEILEFQSGYYGFRKNTERIHFLLNKLSLFEHRHKKVKQLSGGMKRRLMIAKALVHNPKLLLLDEPTAGVDISLRETLWDFVRDLKKEGMSILLTTHYLEEAEMLCDRVGIINRGHIETIGNTKAIIKDFTQREVSLTLNREITVPKELLLEKHETTYRMLIPPGKAIGSMLADLSVESPMIVDIQIKEGSLEEAFLRVLKTKSGETK